MILAPRQNSLATAVTTPPISHTWIRDESDISEPAVWLRDHTTSPHVCYLGTPSGLPSRTLLTAMLFVVFGPHFILHGHPLTSIYALDVRLKGDHIVIEKFVAWQTHEDDEWLPHNSIITKRFHL